MEQRKKLNEIDIDDVSVGDTLYVKGTLKPFIPFTVKSIYKAKHIHECSYVLYDRQNWFNTGKTQFKAYISECYK